MSRDPAFLAECRALQRAVAAHPTLTALDSSPEWPAVSARLATLLGAVHRTSPASPAAESGDPSRVRVVQWNIEHGNWREQVERALLTRAELKDADIITLDEVDFGCARAGNGDVAGDLAAALGLHS